MESLLWALDLCAVVYLCMWALKSEKRREADVKERAAMQASEKDNHA